MTIEPIMPLVLVQDMGPTGKLAQEAAVRPETAHAMNRVMAEELLREESQQIQKPEQGDQANSVKDEGGGSGKRDPKQGSRKRHPEEPEQPPRPSGDPFVGKLVNKKI